MLHLSLAIERQKEWVIMLRKKIVPFKVHVFRQVKRIQVTHLALIFEIAKGIFLNLVIIFSSLAEKLDQGS